MKQLLIGFLSLITVTKSLVNEKVMEAQEQGCGSPSL
jgi:hypothetical protein